MFACRAGRAPRYRVTRPVSSFEVSFAEIFSAKGIVDRATAYLLPLERKLSPSSIG